MASVLRSVRINETGSWLPEVLTLGASLGLSVALTYWCGLVEADEAIWTSPMFWLWSSAGPVLVGPVFVCLRWWRSPSGRLFFGELCWIVMSVPWAQFALAFHRSRAWPHDEGGALLWGVFLAWRLYVEPAIACLVLLAMPFLVRRARPWTHYFGLGLVIYEAAAALLPLAWSHFVGTGPVW